MDTLSAHHEAGHAAVSLLLGEFPEEASIRPEDRPEGRSFGHTSYLPVEARAIARASLGSTEADRDRVMAFLISAAAGPAAQALHMRRGSRSPFYDEQSWDIFGGSKDYEQCERVMGAARSLLVADMDDVVSEAFDLLEQPGVWSSVEHLAADLLRFKELDFAGIRDAVLNHDAIRHQTIADRLGS